MCFGSDFGARTWENPSQSAFDSFSSHLLVFFEFPYLLGFFEFPEIGAYVVIFLGVFTWIRLHMMD
jgi:hypothetical protein